MKVTQEKLPASRLGLEIEITPEMSQQAYDKTLQNLTRNANIPGFRKGKVPRQVILQRFGSRQVKAMALEELLETTIKQAAEQEKIEALGNFELRSPFDDLVSQFEPGNTITVSAVVDVPPQASLNQYKDLTVQAEEIPYNEAQVTETLERQRERIATRVPVEGRPAQEKDLAVIDFKGILAPEDPDSGEEPQEIPGGSAQDFEVELSEGRFIPGFIEGIFGMNVGDTKEVEATFPGDYGQQELAGKQAIFTITLKELKEKELPELDDDFAQEVSEFETLAALQESLSTRFRKEAEDKTKANKQEALLSELVKHLDVELPDTLVRREVDYMITQLAMQFGNQGADIKQIFTKDLVADLRESSRPEAIKRLRRTMALGEVAKLENIKVEEAAIAARVQEVLQEIGDSNDVDMNQLHQVVEEDLLKENILAWLEANNTIELVPEGTLVKEEAPAEAAEEAVDVAATATVETDAGTAAVAEVSVEPAPEQEVAPETEPVEPASEAAPAAEVTVAESEAVEAIAESPASKSKAKKEKTEASETADTDDGAAEAETPAKSTRKKTTPKKTTAKKSDGADKPEAADEE